MRPGEWGRLFVIFAIVFATVLLIGVATSEVFAPQPATEEPTSPGVFAPERNLASGPVETGSIEVNETAPQQTILIDAAHQNTQVRDRAQVLTNVLTRRGHQVSYYNPENKIGQFEDRLSEVDAIVIIAPTQRYTRAEQTALDDFVEEGGRVVLFAEPKRTSVNLFGEVTTRGQTESILTNYSISAGAGYLYEFDTGVGTFQTIAATSVSNQSLSHGVDTAIFHTSTSLTVGDEATPVLETRPTTNSSTLRANASYIVAARQDNVLVVGDSQFLTEQNYQKIDNEELVGNLIKFLIGAE